MHHPPNRMRRESANPPRLHRAKVPGAAPGHPIRLDTAFKYSDQPPISMPLYGERRKEYERERIRSRRLAAIAKLGGECVYCGCNEAKALELNHKKGGGRAEHRLRKEEGKKTPISRAICNDVLAGRRDDIELTCRPCNALHYLINGMGLENKWNISYSKNHKE